MYAKAKLVKFDGLLKNKTTAPVAATVNKDDFRNALAQNTRKELRKKVRTKTMRSNAVDCCQRQ
jgi:hypothetical protein